MRFNVTIDRGEDGVWIVECPAIPGCVSQGATKAEALDNVAEAIRLCHEAMARAFLSGQHSMAEIARHFGVHYSTVSRATKEHERRELKV